MPEVRSQILDLSNERYMCINCVHKIFRSGTVSVSERGSPLSAKSFYSALLHKKDTAAIGAMFPRAVGFLWLLVQALQTPFSMAKANRNSKISVRHSTFFNKIFCNGLKPIGDNLKLNNEYRLTNDESRFHSSGFQPIVQALKTPFSHILVTNKDDAKANRNSKIGVRHSTFFNKTFCNGLKPIGDNLKLNNEYRLTNDESRFHSSWFQPIFQALKTPFSIILVINKDDAKANRNSKIGVRHSTFFNKTFCNGLKPIGDNLKLNNEYRLTNDESRFHSSGFQPIVQALKTPFANRPRLKRGRPRRAFVTPKQQVSTCCISDTTKQRSIKNSPDCSGYNVELAEHYLSGKRDKNFIETLPFRFKKSNTQTSIDSIKKEVTTQTIPLRSIVSQHYVLDYRQPSCCDSLRSFEGAVSSFEHTGKRKYR